MVPYWCHGPRAVRRNIHEQLAATAEAGGEEARALAERLVAPLDAALRLALQDALAAAAEEITTELAPGSVELRLRGRNPEFVVTPPPAESAPQPEEPIFTPPVVEDDDGGMTRINLRMPDRLKARVDQAAGSEGVSVNSWLVRAATAALERPAPIRGAPRVRRRAARTTRAGPDSPRHEPKDFPSCLLSIRQGRSPSRSRSASATSGSWRPTATTRSPRCGRATPPSPAT